MYDNIYRYEQNLNYVCFRQLALARSLHLPSTISNLSWLIEHWAYADYDKRKLKSMPCCLSCKCDKTNGDLLFKFWCISVNLVRLNFDTFFHHCLVVKEYDMRAMECTA